MSEVVAATAYHALNGLYLTPDMWGTALSVPNLLDGAVDQFHRQQPVNDSFDLLSNYVNDTFHRLSRLRYRQGEGGDWFDNIAIFMLISDLTTTYRQITRGLHAAISLATMIHLRTIRAEDDAEYPRIIPAELDDMQIPHVDQINSVEPYMRIFAVEPWISWTERLRAQKKRSETTLRVCDVKNIIADIDIEKMSPARIGRRNLRAARKSIRRSVAMYGKLDRLGDLRKFLQSGQTGVGLHIVGKNYDYRLHMHRESLINSTIRMNTKVSPLSTTIYNKTDDRLCGVCMYYQDTPLLDHVLSTILNVSNEETEIEVLKAMNVFDATRAFYDDPVLPDLKDLNPLTAPTFIENIFGHMYSMKNNDHLKLAGTVQKTAEPFATRAFETIMAVDRTYLAVQSLAATCDTLAYYQNDPVALDILDEWRKLLNT